MQLMLSNKILVNNAYKGKQPQGKAEVPTKIDSYTPEMSISVEYDTNPTSGNLVMMNFDIKNIDFGIVLRPKQQIDLNKSVSKFKITLSNGQPLIDAVVESNGKLSGQTDYLTYMGPKITGIGENGYIKAEMDSEIIQGATMEVVYEIKAMNHSEVDYMTKEFYHYGKAKKPTDHQGKVVKLTPDTVIDYLDKDFVFNPEDPQNKLYEWKVVTKADLVNYLKEEEVTFLNDNYLDDEFLKERMILLSQAMRNTHLMPQDTASIYLYASKQLSTVEDISLDNDAHIVKVKKPTPPTDQTGGNIPYFPDNPGETVIVIPSTGADRNYAIWIGIGVISLLVLGGGIYFIKKRIIDKE